MCAIRADIGKVSSDNGGDNCQREFNYMCLRMRPAGLLVAAPMEPRLRDTAAWTGAVGFNLASHLYVDFAGVNFPLLLGKRKAAEAGAGAAEEAALEAAEANLHARAGELYVRIASKVLVAAKRKEEEAAEQRRG